ncbi:hypothetical protein LguiA_008633 [Lonicera macranthoides]
MSMNKITTLVIFTTLALLCNAPNVYSATQSSAPAPAPGPAVDCTGVILNMADCLSFVSNDSKVDKPTALCCSGLKTVLKTNAECLCEGFKNSANFGIVLNITKALTLPSACHVKAPPFSKCGISLGPSAAPVSSPTASAPSTGATEPTSAPPPGGSGSSELTVSLVFLLLNLIIASFSSL